MEILMGIVYAVAFCAFGGACGYVGYKYGARGLAEARAMQASANQEVDKVRNIFSK